MNNLCKTKDDTSTNTREKMMKNRSSGVVSRFKNIILKNKKANIDIDSASVKRIDTSLSTMSKTVLQVDDNNNDKEVSSSSIISSTKNQQIKLKSCLKKQKQKRSTTHDKHKMPKSTYEIKLPGLDEWRRRSRYISFHDSVKVHLVQPVTELLAEEEEIQHKRQQQQLWYTNDELKEIQTGALFLIQHLMKSDKNSRTKYCIRGLERQFKRQESQALILSAIQYVLDIQTKQRKKAIFNEKHISRAYISVTYESKFDAVQKGRLDEEAIQNITSENPKDVLACAA